MSQEWNIKPRGETCFQCGDPFEDGQVCVSALVFGEDGYTRADHCSSCWEKEEHGATPYSLWQGVYRAPAPQAEEAVKKETAESLLRRLMEDDGDSKENAIYILAVMLERKKILQERDVQWDGTGTKTLVYEHRKTGETFLVRDPGLRLDQLEPVQQEVVALLGGPSDNVKNEQPHEAQPDDNAETPAPVEEPPTSDPSPTAPDTRPDA